MTVAEAMADMSRRLDTISQVFILAGMCRLRVTIGAADGESYIVLGEGSPRHKRFATANAALQFLEDQLIKLLSHNTQQPTNKE